MYDIVAYRPEFKRQVAVLLRHLRRGDEVLNTAYLEWKYERNPYLPTLIYLALHGGEVVGMRGMFGSCWESGPCAERFVVPCADDFVIAPAHRKCGLSGRIMGAAFADLVARGHRVTFSLSAGPVTLAESLASGWRSAGSVREVSRVTRPRSLPWRLGARMWSWSGARRWAGALWRRPFRRLDKAARRAPGVDSIWYAREPRPEAMADLVQRLDPDGRVRHVRDARYLTWRFANPLHAYRFLLSGTDELHGYLVLKANRIFPQWGANIVDWEADTPAVRRALLGSAIEWGGFAELSTWTMSLPEETEALLREAGFTPASRHRLMRQGPGLLVRSMGPSMDDRGPMLGDRRLLDAASWDVRMLYSMSG